MKHCKFKITKIDELKYLQICEVCKFQMETTTENLYRNCDIQSEEDLQKQKQIEDSYIENYISSKKREEIFNQGELRYISNTQFSTQVLPHDIFYEKRKECEAQQKEKIKEQQKVEASLGSQLLSFGKAAVQQVATGMEVATQPQIDERMAICRGCEFFIPDDETRERGKCQKCGCSCNPDQSVFLNKLSQKHMTCPVGKWNIIKDSEWNKDGTERLPVTPQE